MATPLEDVQDAVLAQLNLVCEFARACAGVDFDIDRNRLSESPRISWRLGYFDPASARSGLAR